MKKNKISKELMSEVLNYEVDTFLGINKNEIDYTCCRDENEGYIDISINLYEFAFKCKEWALTKEMIVHSSPTQKKECMSIVQSFDMNQFYYGKHQFYALTEVEAIIKACEWILEMLNEKA